MEEGPDNTVVNSANPNKSFLIVVLLFLLSGTSSLIYQVIWTRMLVFVFGSTTFATSTVLAVFMGGLALGSYIAGKKADKLKQPFLWYGILEGFIGVWALLAPLLFTAAIPLYRLFFEPLHLQVIPFALLRFLVASVILLPPTTCMGATLPLLSRFVTQSLQTVGDRVGSLYAINSLGAVLGALLAGFVLLPEVGLTFTTCVAAGINILLAIAVYLLSKTPQFSQMSSSTSASEEQASEASIFEKKTSGLQNTPVTIRATMICFCLSGAFAMIYEVAWTRTLLMVIGSTTYAFTVMLSTFLIGIFLGSFICARFVDRLSSPVIWLGFLEILLCAASFLSLNLFNYLPYLNVISGYMHNQSSEFSMMFRFLGAGFILIPISFCLGFIFPLVVKVCANDLQRLGVSVGNLYSMNTIGAIIGAFLAGFLIIPWLGSEQSLIATSVANLVLGTVLIVMFAEIRASLKVVCGAVCAFAIFWSAGSPHFWDYRTLLLTQLDRRLAGLKSQTAPSYAEWRDGIIKNNAFPFFKEGQTANVAVVSTTTNPIINSLLTNGHVDASDSSDMENQAMLAVLPLLLKPSARDVCVVGWGSGVTAGYALRFPVKELICSEIEPAVIKTSPIFHQVNFAPENDSRTIIEPSDGRNYLLGTARKFDVVISEPSNPWQAGVCNLFTREYFNICKDSLKPGGIFTMWSQMNEIPPQNLVQVFASLHDVFPYVYIFHSGAGDLNALASVAPLKLNYADLEKQMNSPLKAVLARFKLLTPEQLISRMYVCPDGLEAATKGSAFNTDDTNHLEYEVSRTYENKEYHQDNMDWLAKHSGVPWNYIDWGSMSDEAKARKYVDVARACVSTRPANALRWAEQSLKLKPTAEAFLLIAQIQITAKSYNPAEQTISQGLALYPDDERFKLLLGIIQLKQCNYPAARQYLSAALNSNSSNASIRYYLALTYSDFDVQESDVAYSAPPDADPKQVISICKQAADDDRFVAEKPTVEVILAKAYNDLGQYEAAQKCLKKLLSIYSNGYLTWRVLGESYAGQKEWKLADLCMHKSFLLSPHDFKAAIVKCDNLIASRNYDPALMEIQRIIDISPENAQAMAMLKFLAPRYEKAASFLAKLEAKRVLPK